jgi:glycerophosphoryl diester phosphodiesterase
MGSKSLFPIDSYRSISQALDMGADGSEMDVQLTGDTALVLYHSELLDDMTSCSGPVSEMTAGGLSQCKYTGVYRDPIVTASALFDEVERENHVFTFDCKMVSEDPVQLELFADALVKHVRKYNLVDRCYIESPFPYLIQMLAEREPQLRLFLYPDNFDAGIEESRHIKIYGLVMDWKKISKEEIRIAHNNNLRVTLFNTSTEEENLEAVQLSPDFIQTDKLEHLLKVFGKYRKP